MTEIDNRTNPMSREKTLEGWKEIAAFLNRDGRTVRRWEKLEGLPVRRHQHTAGSSVYAMPSELMAWRTARASRPTEARAIAWWRPRPAIGFACALLLLFISSRGGPFAIQAEAQTAQATTLTEILPARTLTNIPASLLTASASLAATGAVLRTWRYGTWKPEK